MSANIDAKIKYSNLVGLSRHEAAPSLSSDDEFLDIYEAILTEADSLKDRPKKEKKVEEKKKKPDVKKLVQVDGILSDDDETFARNLYLKVLGREPDKTGYDNLMKRLKNENPDREKIIYGFWKSEEGRKRNIEVIGFKKVYMSDLLSLDGRPFVEHAFLQILGRKPDDFDAENYCKAIYSEGKSKEEMIKKIIESKEAEKRKVEVEGFEKAYKKRKFKENILAKPVIGNAVLAMWNILHINRRLAEINDKIDQKNGITKDELNEIRRDLKEINEKLNSLYNPEADTEYLERMNMLLSVRKTLWGDEKRLHISNKASVSTCFFNTNSGEITIGDYTFAGSNVSILTGSHDKYLTGLARRDVPETEGNDIVIGNGVWLGSNSTVLGPCTIGDNAVIAAGAVVVPGTKVPANTIYGGIPARQIGEEIAFSANEAASIKKAMELKNGILFTEGFSEETSFKFKDNWVLGHYLLDLNGKALLEPGTYAINYAYENDAFVKLKIETETDSKEYSLNEKEDSLELIVESKTGNIAQKVSFAIDSKRDDFALTVVRKQN